MPATNMGSPSGAGNPSTGKFVIMDPFSGPRGSPRDNDKAGNYSTGALSTGIGQQASHVMGPPSPLAVSQAGFTVGSSPGLTMPGGTAAPDARLLLIGGGRSNPATNGFSLANPLAAQPLLGFGNGGSRDAGAGPAFTGFGQQIVTATATTAPGAAIVAGYINRGSGNVLAGQSDFGSSAAASSVIVPFLNLPDDDPLNAPAPPPVEPPP